MSSASSALNNLTLWLDQELERLMATDVSTLETAKAAIQLAERVKVLTEVRAKLSDPEIADMREQSEAVRRYMRLRNECQRIADVYKRFADLTDILLPKIQPERGAPLQFMRGIALNVYGVLATYAQASSDLDYAEAEKLLIEIQRSFREMEQLALSDASFGGDAQQ